jgi:hypothetical protein
MYISYSFTTSALDGGEWSASLPGRALPPGKGPPVPIVQEAGWTPEPVWTQRLQEKSFAPAGIEPRSPCRPARSQTLYCLSYPAPSYGGSTDNIKTTVCRVTFLFFVMTENNISNDKFLLFSLASRPF